MNAGSAKGVMFITIEDKLKDTAPAAVLKGATILNMGADEQMKVIQAGTNGLRIGKFYRASAAVPARRHCHARNSYSNRGGGERDLVHPLTPEAKASSSKSSIMTT
jgi:hypothetical protein